MPICFGRGFDSRRLHHSAVALFSALELPAAENLSQAGGASARLSDRDFLGRRPPAEAAWDIGERAPHCYAGKPEYPGQRAEQRILPQMMDRALKTAPPGADLKSWRY